MSANRAVLSLLVLALLSLLVTVSSWADLKQITYVEIKAVDGKVITAINVTAPYKSFLSNGKLTVVLANTYVALDEKTARVDYGPVAEVTFRQDGTNAVITFNLRYSSPLYKVELVKGYTMISVSFPKLPEPPGPKAVKSPEKVRKLVTLKGSPKPVVVKKVQPKPSRPSKPTKTLQPSQPAEDLSKYVPQQKQNVIVVEQKPQRRTINLELVNASLVDVVRLIGYRLEWNLVIDPKVEGQVTLKLKNVDPEQALRVILATQGYSYKKIGNIVYVGPTEKVATFTVEEFEDLGPTKVQVIPLENAQASNIEPIIKSTYPKVEVQVDEATNSLIIKAPVKLIPEIKELVGQLDVPPPPPPPVAPPRTEVIYLNYADPKAVVDMMGNLVPQDAIKIDERLHALVVTGTDDVIENVRAFVETVDVPEPQVQLNLLVISLSENGAKELGVEWQRAVNFTATETDQAGNATFSNWGINFFTRSGLSFQNSLKFLIDRSLATILASPYIATVNGKKAEIHIGERIPIVYFDPRAGMFQAQYTNVGIILNITPYISHNGYVTMELEPSVSEPGEFIQQYPRIQERSARTTVRVKSGDTVIIGGLIRQNDSESWKRVPFLSDIPIIGEFFKARTKNKQKTELVIAVTPIVLQDLPKAETHEQYKKLSEQQRKQWEKN